MDIIEIAKIAVPSLVALIVPFVTYRWITQKMADYQTILSKEIEDYKKDLSKELFKFQTTFSLYQQRKAEAIKDVYSSFATAETQLKEINDYTNWMTAFDANFQNEEVQRRALDIRQKSLDLLKDLEVCCNSNKIYFDSSTSLEIDESLVFFKELISRNITHINLKNGIDNGFIGITLLNDDGGMRHNLLEEKVKTNEKLEENLLKLKNELENQFRIILSAENPNN